MKSPITGLEVDFLADINYVDPVTGEWVSYKFAYSPSKKDRIVWHDAYEIFKLFRICMIHNKGYDFYEGILDNKLFVGLNGKLILDWLPDKQLFSHPFPKGGKGSLPVSYFKKDPNEDDLEDMVFHSYAYTSL